MRSLKTDRFAGAFFKFQSAVFPCDDPAVFSGGNFTQMRQIQSRSLLNDDIFHRHVGVLFALFESHIGQERTGNSVIDTPAPCAGVQTDRQQIFSFFQRQDKLIVVRRKFAGAVAAGECAVNKFSVAVKIKPPICTHADDDIFIGGHIQLLIEHGGGTGGEALGLNLHQFGSGTVFIVGLGVAFDRLDLFPCGIGQLSGQSGEILRFIGKGEDDPAVLEREFFAGGVVQLLQTDFEDVHIQIPVAADIDAELPAVGIIRSAIGEDLRVEFLFAVQIEVHGKVVFFGGDFFAVTDGKVRPAADIGFDPQGVHFAGNKTDLLTQTVNIKVGLGQLAAAELDVHAAVFLISFEW